MCHVTRHDEVMLSDVIWYSMISSENISHHFAWCHITTNHHVMSYTTILLRITSHQISSHQISSHQISSLNLTQNETTEYQRTQLHTWIRIARRKSNKSQEPGIFYEKMKVLGTKNIPNDTLQNNEQKVTTITVKWLCQCDLATVRNQIKKIGRRK